MKGTTLTERDADILILTKKLLELEELQAKNPTDEKGIVIKAIAYRIRHISMGGI
ncbi:hypothetical protein JK188_01940 [Providencia sp. JGM181]|uniref:hypothetical protein n=1 Tax=unclassified Providencia TaxID=2633465 RepID=UPI001BA46095|nr:MULTISPECIES: hypothetical protein [unclassified Providencia]MBS0923238.1 hypothetical protein [Providencia sp. JGM181]MBS0932011.1 hypothetical protein [Providencia sp. JGM172]MBS0996204.1 hypothetical protein [Providencia sp. JGM178]